MPVIKAKFDSMIWRFTLLEIYRDDFQEFFQGKLFLHSIKIIFDLTKKVLNQIEDQ